MRRPYSKSAQFLRKCVLDSKVPLEVLAERLDDDGLEDLLKMMSGEMKIKISELQMIEQAVGIEGTVLSHMVLDEYLGDSWRDVRELAEYFAPPTKEGEEPDPTPGGMIVGDGWWCRR